MRYGDKHNKSLAAKEWASMEGLSVREMEHHMDVEMFLDGDMLDGKWETPIALSSCKRCSNIPWSKGRRRWNV